MRMGGMFLRHGWWRIRLTMHRRTGGRRHDGARARGRIRVRGRVLHRRHRMGRRLQRLPMARPTARSRRVRRINLDAHAPDLPARLREEGALLAREDVARRVRRLALGLLRGEHGHQIVARRRRGVMPPRRLRGGRAVAEIDIWSRDQRGR